MFIFVCFLIRFATPENAGAKNGIQYLNRTRSGFNSMIRLAVCFQVSGFIELKHRIF